MDVRRTIKHPHPTAHEHCPSCEEFEAQVLLHINEMENRINARLDKGTDRMDCIEEKIVKTASAMDEMLEILTMGKSLFKLAGYLGDFVKWVVGVGAACGAVWASFKYDWFR